MKYNMHCSLIVDRSCLCRRQGWCRTRCENDRNCRGQSYLDLGLSGRTRSLAKLQQHEAATSAAPFSQYPPNCFKNVPDSTCLCRAYASRAHKRTSPSGALHLLMSTHSPRLLLCFCSSTPAQHLGSEMQSGATPGVLLYPVQIQQT